MKPKTRNILIAISAAMALIAIAAFLWAFNPVETPFSPKCVFKAATGLSCPGCGGQRAAHALLHGRILEAVGYNMVLVAAVPYLAAAAFARWLAKPGMRQRMEALMGKYATAKRLLWAVTGWFVVRNILGI